MQYLWTYLDQREERQKIPEKVDLLGVSLPCEMMRIRMNFLLDF